MNKRRVLAQQTENGFAISLVVDNFGRNIQFKDEDMANLLSDLIDINLLINRKNCKKSIDYTK